MADWNHILDQYHYWINFHHNNIDSYYSCSKEVIRMQYTTTLPLQSGGRVTIPEHIRKKLGVKDGDLVVLSITTPEE